MTMERPGEECCGARGSHILKPNGDKASHTQGAKGERNWLGRQALASAMFERV